MEPSALAMITAGADRNATTKTGWTPLHMAAASDCAPLVRVLLTAQPARTTRENVGAMLAKPNQRDVSGLTPVHIAAAKGNGTSDLTLVFYHQHALTRLPLVSMEQSRHCVYCWH